MKTFDRKDVYSWANCEEVTINTWGYFGESLKDLKREIKEDQEHKLLSIDSEDSYCFKYVENDTRISCPFFLPFDKVKEIEEPKKYRPFKHYLEFTDVTKKKVGDVIGIMRKDKSFSALVVIAEKRTDINNETVFLLGNYYLSLQDLFNEYLWEDEKGYWQPFGVLDEA